MKKHLILLSLAVTFCLAAAVPSANAQNILTWNTTGNTGAETTENSFTNDVLLSPSTLNVGAGITTQTGTAEANRLGGRSYFDAGDPSPTTLADAISDNEYFQFAVTLTPAASSFTATGFNFIWDGSATGPTSVALYYSTDGFATAGVSLATATLTKSTTTFTNLDFNLTSSAATTTFRLYAYGATSSAGTGGFDTTTGNLNPNVILEGTVAPVPEPATVIGGLLGALGLCWHQRQRFGRLLRRA